MTSARVVALTLVIAASSTAVAQGQSAWPSSQPQQQSAWPSNGPQQPQPQAQSGWPSSPAQPQAQPGWPSSGPQSHQQQQAAWPSGGAPAAPPQQAPWPASAPPGQARAAPPMGGGFGGGGFGGGGGGGMGGPPPAAQKECVEPFTALRSEVQKRGLAAQAGSKNQVSREEMCKLVTEYSTAEAKWIKFAEVNMSKCGIPKPVVQQLKSVHVKTADAQKKLCSAGPAGGPGAPPTLSDALGTASLPAPEPEKRKPGGTLDTLTGNALAR